MRDSLLIFVNGKRRTVSGAAAFRSLSDYLRYDLGLVGTKVVCAEGDCGSCTVSLGRLIGDRIVYAPVCSCIQFMHQLDGTHIVTVEGLTPVDGLNPIQEAMVQCHGAQCGFCTPGFVVSMQAVFDRKCEQPVTDLSLKRGLVGNLCRCTGYQSIVSAGLSVEPSSVRTVDELFPPGEMIEAMRECAGETVTIRDGDRVHFKPTSLSEAIRFKSEHADCTIVAGGSDVGVLINKGLRDPKIILNLSGLSDLRSLTRDDAGIHAGALVSLTELERLSAKVLPEYAKFLDYFGSPPIKNAATIGGNVANGSPIGDSMPALFVLDAEIELAGPDGSRRININDFFTGYRRSVMTPAELITAVHIPLPGDGEIFKLYKVSKRKDLDISAFSAAFRMHVIDGRIVESKIAFGGVAATIIRLGDVEAFLTDAKFDEPTLRQAGKLTRDAVKPLSDVRGSAEYRSQLVENIFRKFFAEAVCFPTNGHLPKPLNGNGQQHRLVGKDF